MRKYLLPENGNYYKANLHCHTLISDGKKTPEEVKELYKSQGYSVIAFTDHNVQVAHPELRDPDFLPLNAVEYNINNFAYPGKHREVKTCHLCLIATRDDIEHAVCYTDSYVKHGNARDYIDKSMRDPDAKDYSRNYSPECVNDMIKRARKAGYFVTYNHPTWSQETPDDYMKYHGMNAVEIYNWSSIAAGYDDFNSHEFANILRGGERIYCIGADDNHNKHEFGDPLCDACGAWIQIKADKLEYNEIGKALLDGNFYTSMGPEIKNLWFEDGTVHIDTSDAAEIDIVYGVKYAQRLAAQKGETVNTAEFAVREGYKYFRLRVRDTAGYYAETNPFYIDELEFPPKEQ